MNIGGLTAAEVSQRTAKGQINVTENHQGRKVRDIILKNTITFFNLMHVAFLVLLIMVGSYKNCLFVINITINTVIGIVQEIRTKKELDSLAILTSSHAQVIRDGKQRSLPVEEIVLDDVVVLKTGDQIPTDAVVLQGEIECNESMLTGEADNITKKENDQVYSGAFVTSGHAVVRVIHVGKDNYIETISGQAKKFKKVNSQLRNSMNQILRIVSVLIIPLCFGLFAKVFWWQELSFKEAVEQACSSGISMIPEGLVLLTSIALTLGVLRLAKKRTVVQELYCIETLARVDVLCLDKTGTLTEGRIKVEKIETLGASEEELHVGFRQLLSAQDVQNATARGLVEFFGPASSRWEVYHVIPFSSDRKYSGVSFTGHGSYFMGAAEFLFPGNTELIEKTRAYADQGLRVILLAKSDKINDTYLLPDDLKPLGFAVMSDVIRKDCQETLRFFKEQGVQLKCISGDDPLTVSRIASKCGMENAEKFVDASTLTTKAQLASALRQYTVFGRVKPEQKKLLVECLQEDGHTVAMTGDGVNDVLALKQADCSIAMASGSEATKHTANIVLLDSNFSSMPAVVREGRRVINNISNASSMYLIKTTFSVLLAIGTIIIGKAYPYSAFQFAIINGCAVGVPTFLLQMEPSFKQVKNDFMQNVFRNAFPAGIFIAVVTFLITNIGLIIDGQNGEMLSTICVLCMGWIYFFMLRRIYSPMSPYRRLIAYTMELVYLLIMIITQRILELTSISLPGVLILIGTITVAPIFIDLFSDLYDRYLARRIQKMAERSGETERSRKNFSFFGL